MPGTALTEFLSGKHEADEENEMIESVKRRLTEIHFSWFSFPHVSMSNRGMFFPDTTEG
jgi:hypothetical protein